MNSPARLKTANTFTMTTLAASLAIVLHAPNAYAASASCTAGGNATCILSDNDNVTLPAGNSITGVPLGIDANTNSPANASIQINGLVNGSGGIGLSAGNTTNLSVTVGDGTDPASLLQGNNYGIYLFAGTGTDIINNGMITGNTLTNGSTAIFLDGQTNPFSVESIVNNGLNQGVVGNSGIIGENALMINTDTVGTNVANSSIDTVENNDLIQATSGAAVRSANVDITTFTNNGQIKSPDNDATVFFDNNTAVTTFTNSSGALIANVDGSNTPGNGRAVFFDSDSSVNTFVNQGTIENSSSKATVQFLGELTDTFTNDGDITNGSSAAALQINTVGMNPAASFVNSVNGTIQSAGTDAVIIGTGVGLNSFTNAGVISGDFTVDAINAINTLYIDGNAASFDGAIDLVAGGIAGSQGGSVAFTNGAEYTPYKNQYFKVNSFDLAGGTFILDPRVANTTAGTTMGNASPRVVGNVDASNGNIDVVVVNDTQYGQLNVDGDIDLDNSTMNVDVQQSGLLSAGNVFDNVITSSGSINYGSFIITDNSALWDFDTVRNAQDLDLQLTADGTGESSQAPANNNSNNGNTGNVITAVVSTGNNSAMGVAPVIQQLANSYAANNSTGNNQIDATLQQLGQYSTQEELADAVESFAPASTGAGEQAVNVAMQVWSLIKERSDMTAGLRSGGNSGDVALANRQFWLQPFGSWAEQDDQQGVSGYDVDTYGIAAGVDAELNDSMELGLAVSYANSDVSSNQNIGDYDTDIESYQLSVYGTKLFSDVLFMNASVALGWSDYDTDRTLFNGSRANADYDSWHTHLNVNIERHFGPTDRLNIATILGADYHYADIDSYHESGAGAFNLDVDDESFDSLITRVGAELSYTASDKWLLFTEASVGYDFMTDRNEVTASLAGTGARFTTQGIEQDEWVYDAAIGSKYSTENGTEVTARYGVNARDNYTEQSVSLNLRVLF